MSRRDALIGVIEALHAEIAALKTNDIAGLEAATSAKLTQHRPRRARDRRGADAPKSTSWRARRTA